MSRKQGFLTPLSKGVACAASGGISADAQHTPHRYAAPLLTGGRAAIAAGRRQTDAEIRLSLKAAA